MTILQTSTKWLTWARAIQSIAQNGLTYTENPFDVERYQLLQDIVAEILAEYTQHDFAVIRNLLEQETGASTPKVDVRGVVFQADALLLVKERLDDGRWTLPGGWANINETPAEATVREIREESGYETRVVKLLALYDRDRQGHPPHLHHVYKIFFLCKLLGGEPTTSLETDGVGFFRESEIPDHLSLARVTKSQLLRFFAHYHQPDLPTDFE